MLTPPPTLQSAFTALLDAIPPSAEVSPLLALLRKRLSVEPTNEEAAELLLETSAIMTQSQTTTEAARNDQKKFLGALQTNLKGMEKILQDAALTADGAWREKVQALQSMVRDMAQQAEQRRQRQLSGTSLVDSLTGIANRVAFDQRMRAEYSRWKRYASPLVVQLWCIDEFEAMRTKHGRAPGDMALMMVARVITNNLRETDYVARYENEHFTVLLPETPLDHTHIVAERLRNKVAANPLHHQGQPVNVTISCGYAALEEGDTVLSLLQRILAALARARATGGGGYSAG